MRGRPVVLIGDTTTGIPLTVTGRMWLMAQGQTPPGQIGKVQYEYNNFYAGTMSRHDPEFIARMNEEGAAGWLLAAVDGEYLYFVREVK